MLQTLVSLRALRRAIETKPTMSSAWLVATFALSFIGLSACSRPGGYEAHGYGVVPEDEVPFAVQMGLGGGLNVDDSQAGSCFDPARLEVRKEISRNLAGAHIPGSRETSSYSDVAYSASAAQSGLAGKLQFGAAGPLAKLIGSAGASIEGGYATAEANESLYAVVTISNSWDQYRIANLQESNLLLPKYTASPSYFRGSCGEKFYDSIAVGNALSVVIRADLDAEAMAVSAEAKASIMASFKKLLNLNSSADLTSEDARQLSGLSFSTVCDTLGVEDSDVCTDQLVLGPTSVTATIPSLSGQPDGVPPQGEAPEPVTPETPRGEFGSPGQDLGGPREVPPGRLSGNVTASGGLALATQAPEAARRSYRFEAKDASERSFAPSSAAYQGLAGYLRTITANYAASAKRQQLISGSTKAYVDIPSGEFLPSDHADILGKLNAALGRVGALCRGQYSVACATNDALLSQRNRCKNGDCPAKVVVDLGIGSVDILKHGQRHIPNGPRFHIDFNRSVLDGQIEIGRVYNLDEFPGGRDVGNDQASQAMVSLGADWQVRLFQHAKNRDLGECWLLRSEAPNTVVSFGGFNDQLTSFRLEKRDQQPNDGKRCSNE